MTKALIIGYGSIGRRHARILSELGCEVAVVSRRAQDGIRRFSDIAGAVHAMRPDYAVVANETSAHASTVNALSDAGFTGKLLIEKPLDQPVAHDRFEVCAVGYNLRFHPVLSGLAEALSGDNAIAVQVYCGQYLPNWRPGTDYSVSYSADAARGGGVLRDLSHELDYLLWLFGPWRRVAALGGRFGNLNITSDDTWALLCELEKCPCATVQINYMDRIGRRELIVNTAQHTYVADLVGGTFNCDGRKHDVAWHTDDTYRAQHRAILDNDMSRACSVPEAARVSALIQAVEGAAARGGWARAEA